MTINVRLASATKAIVVSGAVQGSPSAAGALQKCIFPGVIGDSNISELTISGVLSFSKTGTTARTVTFPDAAITVAGSNYANTWSVTQAFSAITATSITDSGLTITRIPFASTGGLLADDAGLSYASGVLAIAGSAPGTPSAGQVLIGGGAIKAGGTATATQFTSTIATGTAPLVVASTTVVANLNAALLNGTTWAAPGAIGGTTPAAGAFTTLTASGALALGGYAFGVKSGLGYNPSAYPAQVIGSTGALSIAIGVDPSVVAGGAFAGDGSEIFLRRAMSLKQPNAGGTDWEAASLTLGAISCASLTSTGKITTVSAVPGSFADLAAVQTWLAANFT